jgi:iron complex transport system substrate-binding protein
VKSILISRLSVFSLKTPNPLIPIVRKALSGRCNNFLILYRQFTLLFKEGWEVIQNNILPLTLLIFIFLCGSCINRIKNNNLDNKESKNNVNNYSKIKYARGFTLDENRSYTYIVVFNPWQKSDTLATYLLINDSVDYRKFNHRVDFKIQVPVKTITSLSSTYLGMLNILGLGKLVTAATEAHMIYDSVLYHRFLNGTLKNLGESIQLNTESIIGNSPALVMKYIYGGKDASDTKIIEAGIPIAYNLEYLETSPLGRAEWLKFTAAFVNKSALADSLFKETENSYLALTHLTDKIAKKPTILDGSCYKGVWYEAGGKSYPAQLYKDAGAEYYWKNDSTIGTIPLSLEVILDKQVNADYWIGPSIGSKNELLAIESRYALLKSFREGNIYQFSKRINPNGGLDYYESGVMHPDILLKDLIWVFHHELLDSSYEPVYLKKIN